MAPQHSHALQAECAIADLLRPPVHNLIAREPVARNQCATLLVPDEPADLRVGPLGAQICVLVYVPQPDGLVTGPPGARHHSGLPGTPGDGLDCAPVFGILAEVPVFADVPDGNRVVVRPRGHVHASLLSHEGAHLAPVRREFVDHCLLDPEVVDQNAPVFGARVQDVPGVEAEGGDSLVVLAHQSHHGLRLQIVDAHIAIRVADRYDEVAKFEAADIVAVEDSAELDGIGGRIKVGPAVEGHAQRTTGAPVEHIEVEVVPDIGDVEYFVGLGGAVELLLVVASVALGLAALPALAFAPERTAQLVPGPGGVVVFLVGHVAGVAEDGVLEVGAVVGGRALGAEQAEPVLLAGLNEAVRLGWPGDHRPLLSVY